MAKPAVLGRTRAHLGSIPRPGPRVLKSISFAKNCFSGGERTGGRGREGTSASSTELVEGQGPRKHTVTVVRASQRVLYTPPTQEASDQHTCKRSGAGLQAEHPNSPSPPGSMSESVRCVNEKLAMLAGEMENLEYGTAWGQLCSALRGGGGGGEKYFDVCREGLELRRLLVVFDMKGSGEKSSSHSKPPPTSTKQDITLL